MVTFFPTPYPDELLYSSIARFHIRSGNNNAKATLNDLFNSSTVTAVLELPSNINRLLSNLPIGATFDAEELIYKHTMFPYYTAFIAEDRGKKIYDYMLSDNGSKIYAELGLGNSYIKLNTYFRFCHECVKDDIKLYGETYWHRIHQVAGLDFCIKHRKPLYNSTAAVRLKNRQEYVNAMMEICIDRDKNDFKPVEIINCEGISSSTFEEIKNKSLRIGRNIDYLLNNKMEFKELNYFREFYIDKLIQNKLASGRNLIYQDELLPKFKSFWGEHFLEAINCNFDIDMRHNWVSTITRKHRKGFHPIQHILFAEFLSINIADMFKSKEIFEVNRKKYQPKCEDEIIQKRNRWLELMRTYSNESKSFIRYKDISVYTWLYKYDTEWLNKNSPTKKVGNRKDQLIDWDKRDEEIFALVKVAVYEIKMSEEKPERITVTSIAKKINKVTLMQRHIDRLFKTKEFLNYNVESLEEFQLRRVKWAIKELAKEGEVREWDVIIKAGLSKKFYNKLKDSIEELITAQI